MWLWGLVEAIGGRVRSPQRRGVRKDDMHEGSRGGQTRSATKSVSEMGALGDGEDRNYAKLVMEVVGDDIGSVREDWADSEIMGEIPRTGDVDKDNRDLCSLFLGEQTSCMPEGTEVATATCEVHVQSMAEGVGLCNIKKPSTWTRLTQMDVRPVGLLKEGAKSFLGKRQKVAVLDDREAEKDSKNGKKLKVGEDFTMNEAAGVVQHPCREQ